MEKITMEQGLPTNEVYHIIEGGDGYIWMATSNGLCRYNGTDFKIYDSQDGLPTSAVYHLFPQDDSTIVGVCSNSEFFRFEKDSVSFLIHPDTSHKYLRPYIFPYSFQIDKFNHIHIGCKQGYYCFDRNSSLIKADSAKSNYGRHFVLKSAGDDKFILYNRIPRFDTGLKYTAQLWFENVKLSDKYDPTMSSARSIYFSQIGDHFLIPVCEEIFDYNIKTNELQMFQLEGDCIGVYSWENQLFVCTDKGGAYGYRFVEGELIKEFHVLDGFSVSSITKTDSGIYWISTLEDGVRKIQTAGPKKLYESPIDENITSFGIRDSSFIVGFESGKIFSQEIGIKKVSKEKIYHIMTEKKIDFISAQGLFLMDRSGNLKSYLAEFESEPGVRLTKQVMFNDSARVSISYQALQLWGEKSNDLQRNIRGEVGTHFLDLHVIDNICYIPTNENILMLDPSSDDDFKTTPIESKTDLIFNHDGQIYALTYDSELFQLVDGNFQLLIESQVEVIGNTLSSCYLNGLLAITTNKGVYVFDLKNGGDSMAPRLIDYEPIPLGIQIAFTDEYLYFATPRMLYKKPTKNFSIDYPFIEEIQVQIAENTFSHTTLEELNHDQNDIEFHLCNASFREPFKHYKYKLEGRDKQFYTTTENTINYDHLAPGNYQFIVSATSDGYNYSDEKRLRISIAYPYWMTGWFWTIIFIIVFVLSYWLVSLRIKRIKSTLKMRASMAQLKSQALAAQLNPHLVFNIMNSIQGMVSEGQAEEANIYISRFSKYLRNTLKRSKISTITLKEELEMIEQYLKLEKLRFGDQLNYEMDLKIKDQSIAVPPLIIQPIVENAIKHGIRPNKNQKGQIQVIISEGERFLIIEVKDNGVGFSKNPNWGDGIRITDERLKVMSKLNGLKMTHQEDLTIVTLTILK